MQQLHFKQTNKETKNATGIRKNNSRNIANKSDYIFIKVILWLNLECLDIFTEKQVINND